jgi:hypothetical protein
MKIEHIIRRNNPYRYPQVMEKIKSFDQYAAEVKAKRLADKMLMENLKNQLAEAKVALVNNVVDIPTMEMQKQVADLHRLFNAPPQPQPEKRMTSKQKIALEIEKRQRENELKITQEILRGVN